MIFLTGDIHQNPHQASMDQPYTEMTEMECGLEYAKIAAEFGVKVTLFITGKAVIREYKILKKILVLGNTECGGHTFDARETKKWVYFFSRRFFGFSMGPRVFQSVDIDKTIKAFKEKLDIDICSWRSHAYRYDRNTTDLLKSKGIRYISSDVEPEMFYPVKEDNVYKVFINVLPDHDHMIHGYYTEKVLRNQILSFNRFSNRHVYSPSEWLDVVKEQIQSIVDNKCIAVILAHPICQKIADDFNTFRKLCSFLTGFKTLHISETSEAIK